VSPARTSDLLDAIFRYAPIGLGFWDTDLRYRRINPALAAINGRAVEDHLGRTLPEVLGPLGEEVEEVVRGVLDTGRPLVDVDVFGQTEAQPGVDRQWRATYYPVGPDDARTGVAAAVIEVTEERTASRRERRALEQTQAATALLDAVIHAAPVAICLLDLDLRYQRVNAALVDLTGRGSADDVLGRRPSEIAGDMGEKVEALMRRTRDSGEPVYEVELAGELPNRPGETFYREGSWFPVRDGTGAVAGVAGVVRDTTERHQAEVERRRLLKAAVTERGHAEAAQVRAESARRAAEAAQTEAEEARARTEFLAEAGRRMASSMDFERTLQRVAEIVVPRVADWCTITLDRGRPQLEVVAIAHADPGLVELARDLSRRYPPLRDAEGGAGRVIRTGEMKILQEITDETLARLAQDPEHLEAIRALGLRSALVVPLTVSGRTIGALSLIHTREDRRFEDADIVLAQGLADLAAVHLRNAQLYTERSHIARTLQRGLLPRALPDIPGMELAARYLAAGDQNVVGGDFYDAFAADESSWAIMIGDVAGKGPEAATLTSLTRHTLRAAAMHDDRPMENLRTLNRALLAELDSTRFSTVVHGRVRPSEPAGAVVTLATGGHPPPLVLRADGTVETVPVRGALVGWMAEAAFGEADVELTPGDLLLLYTDGVTEVRGRGPEFGENHLAESLAAMAGRSAEEAVDGVLHRAVGVHGEHAPDDIALLALRALPA